MLNAIFRPARERFAKALLGSESPLFYRSLYTSSALLDEASAASPSAPADPSPSSEIPSPSSSQGDTQRYRRRPGPVRLTNLPKYVLYSDIQEMLSAVGIADVERSDLHFEYDFKGTGVPLLKAVWYNPGGGPESQEKRNKALRLNDSILSYQQISAATFPMEDFRERTRLAGMLKRALWIDNLPERFTESDLEMLFRGYELADVRPIQIMPKMDFGFTVPEEHRVAIVRMQSLETAMQAFRELQPRISALKTQTGGKARMLLYY